VCSLGSIYKLYWFLWYHDLLISGVTVRVIYSLIRRKYLPYPNLGELRQRRKEQDRADDITRQVINRLASSPADHVKDLWSTFRDYRHSKRDGGDKAATPEAPPEVPDIVLDDDSTRKSINVLLEDDVLGSDTDLRGPILEIANEIADIHERVRK
jgi:GRAM domain-containing protein 4